MSLIIPEATMPDNCMSCPCHQQILDGYIFRDWCGVKGCEIQRQEERPRWCTLFEVKDWRDI